MDSCNPSGKRKLSNFQQPNKSVYMNSTEVTPCLPINKYTPRQTLTENPEISTSTAETTHSTIVSSTSNNKMSRSTPIPQRNSNKHTPLSDAGKSSVYFTRPSSKGPFSVETPFFSNKETTPLVLATARQNGSTIMTSCNRDSIRHLQNPYSDGIMGSTSSESIHFNNETRALPKTREVTSSAPMVGSDVLGMNQSDVFPFRNVEREDGASSTDTQVYEVFS